MRARRGETPPPEDKIKPGEVYTPGGSEGDEVVGAGGGEGGAEGEVAGVHEGGLELVDFGGFGDEPEVEECFEVVGCFGGVGVGNLTVDDVDPREVAAGVEEAL